MMEKTSLDSASSWPRALWKLYAGLGFMIYPIAGTFLAQRMRRGKEWPGRTQERLGLAGQERPAGPLMWCHAASLGESLSVLPLVNELLSARPDLNVLITTITRSSAEMLGMQLGKRACHQFAPLDLPVAVRSFLDHWQPDLAVWIESELWPTMIRMTAQRNIPMALIQARLSARSHKRWSRFKPLSRSLLSYFEWIAARGTEDACRFESLGGHINEIGDLKRVAPPPADDPVQRASIAEQIGKRPVWLAASTHEGEEKIVAVCHEQLKSRFPNLLTLIVPRHPERGPAIQASLQGLGFRSALRSSCEEINPHQGLVIADSLGELGIWYRLVDIVFIGGSLTAHGGHNPLEAARLKCALLLGPDMSHFNEITTSLLQAGGAYQVRGGEELAERCAELLTNYHLRWKIADAGYNQAHLDEPVLGKLAKALLLLIDKGISRKHD